MNPSANANAQRILILREDRFYAEALAQFALRVFPEAQITITTTVGLAASNLSGSPFDLLITGVGAAIEGDVLELLMSWVRHRPNALRVLVVTASRQYRTLEALRKLAIAGVFDSNHEPPDALSAAIKIVTDGGRYWSPSVLDFMSKSRSASTPLSYLLTLGEQVILSIVGDGSDDATAANELGISPATVSTVRRDLHRKLGVQHRGELIRVAAQNGFVQFTPSGVVRPGFAIFSAEYYARRTRRLGACPRPRSLPSAMPA